MKKIKPIFFALTICISLCGCQSKPETKEYRFAGYYQWFLGQPEYQDIFTAQENDAYTIDKAYGEEAYQEGDYLILHATDEQRDALIKQNETIFQEALNASSFLTTDSITIDDQYETITISLDDHLAQQLVSSDAFLSSGQFNFGKDLLAILNITLANHVLLCGDSDIGIQVTIQNQESDHIAAQAYYPYQSVSITQTDWETSRQQDVKRSSETEGYQFIKATIQSIDEQRIIFALAEDRPFYEEEPVVELCFDSVYADDLYLPYQLEKGDCVFLEADGLVALHEDDDDIPDIAPLAIIPEKYIQ